MREMALVCPTRGRPERAREFALSVMATADRPERLEILFYVDDDDARRAEYGAMVEELGTAIRGGRMSLCVGPAIGVPHAVNRLVGTCDSEVLLSANDDQVYLSAGWDTALDAAIERYRDGIYCIWFNDGWESENLCTFPIVGRKWVDTLGYLQFPFFEHFFADAWIWMLAKSIGRAHYLPEIHAEHRHWKIGKAEIDDTYRRLAGDADDPRQARDRAVIDRFERYFLADVDALRAVIDGAA
jgi:glycosyl transferase/beta-hydroxylase protein BlmF